MAKKTKTTAEPTAKQLLKQLAAAPRVDVLGIVHPGGVGAGISQGEKLWTLTFSFAAWRIVGQPLQRSELVVRRLVQERAIARYQKTVRENVPMRIRARVVDPSVFGRADALLEQVVGPVRSDKELNAELKRLQKPVRIKDPNLGMFTLDRQAGWFEGKMSWNGRRVRLCLDAAEPGDVERALRVARTLWRGQKQWQAKVQAYAIKKALPHLNEVWLAEDERPVSAEQFLKRMKLESVTVWPDGTFEFWHDDGDLFGGHSIEITGDLKKGCTDVDLAG